MGLDYWVGFQRAGTDGGQGLREQYSQKHEKKIVLCLKISYDIFARSQMRRCTST